MVEHDESTCRNLYRLPNDILVLMFSFLTDSPSTLYQCTLVNRTFYELINPLLWKAPVCGRVFVDCMLRMTRHRRHILGQLIRILATTFYWKPNDLQRLLPSMPQLTHLALQRPTSSKCVHLAPRYCPRLISLTLDQINTPPSAFINMATYCHDLVDFDWSLSPRDSPWCLRLLRPLRRLRLDVGVHKYDDDVIGLIQAFDQLTALTLVGVCPPFLGPLLADPTVFPQLTSLQCDTCNDIDDVTLIAFLHTHPQLQHLDLPFSSNLTDAALDAMCVLPRLTRLDLTASWQITSAAVRRLIHACPLTSLQLDGCPRVLPADFPELAVTKIARLDHRAILKIRPSLV